MKKVFRLTAIAVIAMGLATACGNNKNAEVEDTSADTLMTVVEETIDSVVEEVAVEEPVVEEPKKPATKKPAVKKEEGNGTNIAPTKLGENTTPNNTTTKGSAKKVENTITPTDLSKKGTNTDDPSLKKGKK